VPLDRDGVCLGGGATQDPADKPGVGNMVANLLDEGSGDLIPRPSTSVSSAAPSN
jgi:zinc protease